MVEVKEMNKQQAIRLAKRIRRDDPLILTELRHSVETGRWSVDCYRAGVGFRVSDGAQWQERHDNIVFLPAQPR